jgi:sialidase-1
MKNRFINKNIAIILLIFLVAFPACAPAQKTGKIRDIVIATESITAPVLKKAEVNPLFKLRIYVPAGKRIAMTGLQLRMDEISVKAFEKVEIFFTGKEPMFASTKLLSSATQFSAIFTLPAKASLEPGLNYIWVSGQLKHTASMDAKLSLDVLALEDAAGKKHFVQPATDKNKKRVGISIRKPWDDSVHSYRIPGITTTDKGTLLAVYDIRYKHSGDLPANIDVGMSRSADGGNTWEPMKVIMDMGAPHENNGIGDPAILFDPVTKKIWVAALWSKGNRSIAGSEPGLSPDTTGQFVLVSSDDDGKTWSAPYNITAQVKDPKWHLYFNGPGNGIAMKNGVLVFRSQYWDEGRKPGLPHSSIIYSEDHGKTWKSGIGAKSNTTESQVVETTPGTLMLNMRDNRGRYRSIATTTDMGKTWTEHITSYKALPDPVCMAGFIKARVNVKGTMRDVLFFSNVNSNTARENMTVKASLDMGETWLPAHELLIDERRSFGYSVLTKIDDNTIGLLYEGIRDLNFVRIRVDEIIR